MSIISQSTLSHEEIDNLQKKLWTRLRYALHNENLYVYGYVVTKLKMKCNIFFVSYAASSFIDFPPFSKPIASQIRYQRQRRSYPIPRYTIALTQPHISRYYFLAPDHVNCNKKVASFTLMKEMCIFFWLEKRGQVINEVLCYFAARWLKTSHLPLMDLHSDSRDLMSSSFDWMMIGTGRLSSNLCPWSPQVNSINHLWSKLTGEHDEKNNKLERSANTIFFMFW